MSAEENINLSENEHINRRGKVTTVFSLKGGVGKSLYAVNIALEMAQIFTNQAIALVDFNVYNPDIATMLGIETVNSKDIKKYFCERGTKIEDIKHSYEGVENIDLFLTEHNFMWMKEICSEKTESFIEELKNNYDYIVIDTHPAIDAINTYIPMRMADNLICVTTPDIPSLRNVDRDRIEKIKNIGINGKINMLLTRYKNKSEISVDMVKQETGLEDIICIQEKSVITDSVNKGIPLVLGKTNDKSVKKIREEIRRLISNITGINLEDIKNRG